MGCALLVRREALDEVGLFDDRFFIYTEETDLCRRLGAKGWETHYVPEITIAHHVSQFSADVPERRIVEHWRSRHRYWEKHHSPLGARTAAALTGLQYAAARCGVVGARTAPRGEAAVLRVERQRRVAQAPGEERVARRDRTRPRRARGRMERAERYDLVLALARRWPWEIFAVPALLVVRLLPETGAGLYLRLAVATVCLLVPGSLIARAIGRPSVFGALVWSLAGLAATSGLTFLVHGSLGLALWLYIAIGVVALPFCILREPEPVHRESLVVGIGVALAGIGFGIALWSILGSLEGDGLFHLARIRKLDAFGDLSLSSVNEFADGGLHPGYAFPLWHVFLALVARVAAVDPGAALLHEPAVLVPIAFVITYEAGLAVFRRAWAGLGAVLAQVALTGLAPGSGGAYAIVALPASTSRHLLAPAVVAAFFSYAAKPGRAAGCHSRSGLARADDRPSDVHHLRRRSACGVRRRAGSALPRRDRARHGCARLCRAAGDRRRAVPRAGCARDRVPQPVSRGEGTRARALRRSDRHHLARALPSEPGDAGTTRERSRSSGCCSFRSQRSRLAAAGRRTSWAGPWRSS